MKIAGILTALTAALVFQLGCQIDTTSNQPSNPGNTTQKSGAGADKNASPEGTNGAQGDGATDPADPSDPDSNVPSDNNGAPADTSAIVDIHWETPSCPSSVCYDTKLNSDGTYQKQRIVMSGAGVILFCEHGTWQASGGSIAFSNSCSGDNYEQTWSSSSGSFVLQGVRHSASSSDVFNCAETECK